jgi:dihydropteroate synthase
VPPRRGISPDRVILDPGIGFGKRGDQNWQRRAGAGARRTSRAIGCSSVGRKALLEGARALPGAGARRHAARPRDGRDERARRAAGAWAVRVHDVAATRDALAVARAWAAGGA